jgi:hypothetical protein
VAQAVDDLQRLVGVAAGQQQPERRWVGIGAPAWRLERHVEDACSARRRRALAVGIAVVLGAAAASRFATRRAGR